MATIRKHWGRAVPMLLSLLLCGALALSADVAPALAQASNQIEGFVINDANGNRVPDRVDSPLSGVTMTLQDTGGAVLATTLTDASGRFQFQGIATGVYLLSQTAPPGFSGEEVYPGTDGVKIDENTVRINMVSGLTSYNGTVFLDHQMAAAAAGPNLIAGTVFSDANGNGILDAGDSPLANVTVTLRDASNQPVATAITSVAGSFVFVGLANGTYTLVQTVPAGYTGETAIPGTGGQVVDPSTIRVATIEGITTYAGQTFLDRPAAVPAPGPNTISGLVINDLNGNHVPDPGEPPLAGAVLTLQNTAGQLIAAATTGADGSFTFANLPNGTYMLAQQAPPGFTGTAVVPGVGGQALGAAAILVTTIAGVTSYPSQIFLDQAGGTPSPAKPAILGVTPPAGGPGSTVTITGRGFGPGPVQVLFGTTPAMVLSSSSLLNSLVALVPDLPPGPTPITLANVSGPSNAVTYTVTPPGSQAALGPLFLPSFNALGAQSAQAQVGPTMQVVIAQSLGYAQNQAVAANIAGAAGTLRSLLVRINRSPDDLVTPAAKAALAAQLNLLIAQLG